MTQAQEQAIEQLKTLTNRRHGYLTGRAAAGIFAVLRAAGIQGKDVLLPANTCYIVLWAIIVSGNRPRLTDIDPHTGSVTSATLEAVYTPKTAAVIPCHLYGIPAPIAEICQWAKAHKLVVIEDAALAIGNQPDGKSCGSWGDASILSFGLGKTVDVELGGAVLTDDEALAKEVQRILRDLPIWNPHLYRLTRNWNELYWVLHRQENTFPETSRRYAELFQEFHEITAYQVPTNYWDDLPLPLDALDQNLAHRRALANVYYQQLVGTPVRLLEIADEIALWKYPVFVESAAREEVLDALWSEGFHEVTCWYPSLQKMATALLPGAKQPPTPQADRWGTEVINLPLSQDVSEADAIAIAETLKATIF